MDQIETFDSRTIEESLVLKSILKRSMTATEFFENSWQKESLVSQFREEAPLNGSVSDCGDGTWNEDRMQEQPLEETVRQGWNVLLQLLEQVQNIQEVRSDDDGDGEKPLIFKAQELQSPDDVLSKYGKSIFSPYLDGCSIVINHGDLLSPWIAFLCQDLQKVFPHVYANCYLTPPNMQAVPAHADDRDVFVFQLVGSKAWRVYQTIPIPYPYPHEQVGKEGVPVPPSVLEGPVCVSTTLHPGDVLYMPRGFVHQAQCHDQLSFHVTIALATHDWSLAGMMSMATEHILTKVVNFRQSILPLVNNDPSTLQSNIDLAINVLKEQITADSILTNLHSRLEKHNHRAFPLRMRRIHQARFPQATQDPDVNQVVGPLAAERTNFHSILRSSTFEERDSVADRSSTEPRGLLVREDCADSILSIISEFKAKPSLQCRVIDLRSLMPEQNPLVCDLSLLSFAKRCVELGALAIVNE